jgi:hypothetical protein
VCLCKGFTVLLINSAFHFCVIHQFMGEMSVIVLHARCLLSSSSSCLWLRLLPSSSLYHFNWNFWWFFVYDLNRKWTSLLSLLWYLLSTWSIVIIVSDLHVLSITGEWLSVLLYCCEVLCLKVLEAGYPDTELYNGFPKLAAGRCWDSALKEATAALTFNIFLNYHSLCSMLY